MNCKILTLFITIKIINVDCSIKGLVNNFGGFDGLSFLKFGTCDISKCSQTPKHYEELGCLPILNDGDCCPKSFDCSHLSVRSYSNKCFYKGKTLSESSKITNDESLQRSCINDVRCMQQGKFFFRHETCSELFGPSLELGCIRVYARDKCCSVGTVCGDDAERLPICKFEGKTYRMGERMYSNVHKCHQCLCTSDFTYMKNMTANKDCFKINCNIELREVENINNNCVPIYHNDVCCPYNWRCPHRNDAIVPGDSSDEKKNKTSQKCKFGNLEFNIGDRLSVREKDECSNCTCLVPPMLSCIYSHTC
ncbi:hypothetical protein PVAND_003762 [Polypedilum vanderplanki]|uniref:VWFC domain-containing protein n=1 Tax=Polypedilum vanderplanki TaxID=319348 RepID=A0A9J6BWW4_POLVA|nr:hypothetical protein PVAND_003762 [Polypedilum vanderplanki]